MVLLSIFYESDPLEDHQQVICYSFCRSMRLLFIYLVKILLQIFLYEDLSTLALHTSVSCISLQNTSRTALCYAAILPSESIPIIFDINHQQNTRRSDQIETIKTIIPNYTPSYHMEGFTNGSGCHFKKIFDQVRRFRLANCFILN